MNIDSKLGRLNYLLKSEIGENLQTAKNSAHKIELVDQDKALGMVHQVLEGSLTPNTLKEAERFINEVVIWNLGHKVTKSAAQTLMAYATTAHK